MARSTDPEKVPETPYVAIVEDFLRKQEEFVNSKTIAEGTKLHPVRVNYCLSFLKQRKAVDFVEQDGRLYWCLSPQTDTRKRKHETWAHKGDAPPSARKPKQRAKHYKPRAKKETT